MIVFVFRWDLVIVVLFIWFYQKSINTYITLKEEIQSLSRHKLCVKVKSKKYRILPYEER